MPTLKVIKPFRYYGKQLNRGEYYNPGNDEEKHIKMGVAQRVPSHELRQTKNEDTIQNRKFGEETGEGFADEDSGSA